MSQKKIWALLDDRAGNTSQTLGVAEALGVPFETRKIAFNGLIKLPNFLVNHNRLGFGKTSELAPPWPDITIGTARRLGIAASYIKSQNPNCFLVQIQWPGFPSNQFDLIIPPLHDHIPPADNVFTSLGAPHRVTDALLKKEAELWQTTLSHLPSPKIALLIGGGGSAQTVAARHADIIAKLSSRLAHTLGGSLCITTSRRTGKEMAAALPKNLSCPYYLHQWRDDDNGQANPYYGFLGLADAVIVTGDSVSMCSEACATGKSVYIYGADDFMSRKHKAFVEALYERGLAKPLQQTSNQLFTPPYKLNDAISIAGEIKKRVLMQKD